MGPTSSSSDLTPAAVVAAAAAGLARAAAEIELEQAVRGIDTHDELALHPLLAAGLHAAGYGVHREERYPSDRRRARRTEGRRCDLVITPDGLPLVDDRAQPELFAPARACPLHDALWLEVKVIAQFREGGAPNRSYARALTAPVWRDVEKLAADEGIARAAVLVVLFTADVHVADHDLATWCSLGRARGLLFATPEIERVPINDRVGNALCTVAAVPLILLMRRPLG